MNTTDSHTPVTTGPSGPGDQLAGILTLVGTVFVAGPPVLVAFAGTVLLALMLAGPFALLVTFALALVAATALVALAAAILATPYLLVRHARAQWLRHAARDKQPRLVVVGSPRPVA